MAWNSLLNDLHSAAIRAAAAALNAGSRQQFLLSAIEMLHEFALHEFIV